MPKGDLLVAHCADLEGLQRAMNDGNDCDSIGKVAKEGSYVCPLGYAWRMRRRFFRRASTGGSAFGMLPCEVSAGILVSCRRLSQLFPSDTNTVSTRHGNLILFSYQ